jgi:glutathione peroxidase
MSNLTEIEFNTMTGETSSLADFAGDVLLVVNVASKCGLTPQYEGLQALYTELGEQGFSVLGFPANNFAGQEPGTDAEIATFCSTSYGVTFPVFSKISVVGDDQHPLYSALAAEVPVSWNFEKFLIARDGSVAGRFAPGVTPDDPELRAAIATQLAAS